jgi:hypothetical protein
VSGCGGGRCRQNGSAVASSTSGGPRGSCDSSGFGSPRWRSNGNGAGRTRHAVEANERQEEEDAAHKRSTHDREGWKVSDGEEQNVAGREEQDFEA